ncbi:MAG TPA: transporter substrate-binding domain-containing protein [Caulobacteraceae bacterium]|nr:transporter substrate-binding domain-containing protein [Caulobacteraceae bacterium]
MKPDADVIKSLAPTGRLRAAINLGNSVLAQKDPVTGQLGGASVALATELAHRLGVPLDPVLYASAGKVVEDLNAGVWDVAFMAAEPERAGTIAFTAPYVIIEGAYLVRDGAAFRVPADLDRDGVRIACEKGAAYTLFLQRTIKHATLATFDSAGSYIELFKADRTLDAAAGVRQALVAAAPPGSGFRVLPEGFQKIAQAMGTPRERVAGARYLDGFIDELKATPFIREALQRSGQDVAIAAPPG